MAILKDLIVNGATRLIGDAFANKITISTLADSTGSIGSNGQVLKSNGTNLVWGADNNSVTGVKGSSESSYRTGLVSISASNIGLGNVENTKLSTWAGSGNITTLGTITTGTWTGSKIGASYLPTATTAAAGIVQLSSATNSNSEAVAATSKAVKAAYDLANSYKGTVTSVTLSAGTGIAIDSASAITSTGTRTISLATVDVSSTTSTVTGAHGASFDVIDSIDVDAYGRVTAINVAGVELPADSNTHYTTHLYVNKASGGATSNAATTNTNTYIHLYDDTTKRDTIQIKGAGATTVTANSSKLITITSTDTTYTAGTGIDITNKVIKNTGITAINTTTTNLNFRVNNSDNIAIPTATLTLFNKTYDASTDVTITPEDIGLSSSMNFKGIVTNDLSDGSTTKNVTLKGGGSITAAEGDVVIDSDGELYVWSNNAWRALGYATDYALLNHTHGNITNDGKVTTTATIANGMHLLLTNSSSQVVASGITFGTSANYALNNKGEWIAVNNYTLPIADSTTLGGIKVGTGLTITAAGVLNHSNSTTAGTAGTTASTSGTALDIPYLTYDALGHIIAAGTHTHTITAANGNARVFYGTCSSGTATTAKVVTCSKYDKLEIGDVVLVKFQYRNTGAVGSLTLNVNNTGAKSIKKRYGTTENSNLANANELTASGIHLFMYDGTYWVYTSGDYNSTYTVTSVWCNSTSTTAIKASSNASYYALRAGNMFEVTTRYDNTAKAALTFNVNGTGAKPLYINGKPSSSSNYTLPAGKYLVYYDGTSYDFYTNGGAKFGAIYTTTASYGETLPATGSPGQLFFLTSTGNMYELPTGGAANSVLVKNSASDRDVKWATSVATATNASNATNAYTSASTAKAYVVGSTVNSASFKALVHNASVYTQNTVLFGAAWNDYAEFRKDNQEEEQGPGRCVSERGDGSLALTTKRLQRGCEIISDTFGFAIGQDEKNGYNTPVAISGRVLAYIYEGKEAAKSHIGWPVCSGPDGTVSIMTEEEEEKYPSRIIGIISEVPDYEYWGAKSVAVKERVWIRVK